MNTPTPNLRDLDFTFDYTDSELRKAPYIKMFGVHTWNQATPSFTMHRNDGIEICLAIKGEVKKLVEGQPVVLKPGEISVTCPWQAHSGIDSIRDKGTMAWLILLPTRFHPNGSLSLGKWSTLDPQTESEIGRLLASNPSPNVRNIPQVDQLFLNLWLEIISKEIGNVWRMANICTELLLHICRRLNKPNVNVEAVPSGIRKAMQALQANMQRKWTLTDLNKIAKRGPTSLSEGFRSATGFPPLEYLVRLRVEKAKAYLHESSKSITAIALEVGFCSSQHFTGTFKRFTGITPSAYRRKSRQTP